MSESVGWFDAMLLTVRQRLALELTRNRRAKA